MATRRADTKLFSHHAAIVVVDGVDHPAPVADLHGWRVVEVHTGRIRLRAALVAPQISTVQITIDDATDDGLSVEVGEHGSAFHNPLP